MRTKLVGVAVLACVAAGLTACGDRDGDGGGRADASMCTPFSDASAAAPADPTSVAGIAAPVGGGEAAVFDDCLHRWGYRLARSEDAADIVGAATVAACAPALSRWNQASMAQAPTGPDTATSLVTGESAGMLAERYANAQGKAMFYVVQARAGNCAPPPAAATPATKN